MRVLFLSFGCKVNQVEMQSLREEFERRGATACEEDNAPDICIINTCSVTSTAETKLRRKVRSLRTKFPHLRIVLIGCYPTRRDAESLALDGVEAVFANRDKWKALAYFFPDEHDARDWFPISTSGEHSRAFIKIQDGCDNTCSYCVVRLLRGAPASRPSEDVIREIRALDEVCVPEIVLSGINLGSWGSDRGEPLSALFRQIIKARPRARIRISSVELQQLTDDLLDVMADGAGIFCAHLHLPLQSGSDEILRAMGRRYTSDEFLARVEAIHRRIDGVGLTTDCITGFPGEGLRQFGESLRVCRAAGFHRIHAFSYSPRPGTEAYRMTDDVPGDVKRERVAALEELAGANCGEFVARLGGKPLEVVFDGDAEPSANREGYSGEYLTVRSGGFAVPGRTLLRVTGYRYEADGVELTEPAAPLTSSNSQGPGTSRS
ncbi:MAG: MiaB/RimO family radical SAM methylthiotransferase [Candidatus Brocadiia bacterium]